MYTVQHHNMLLFLYTYIDLLYTLTIYMLKHQTQKMWRVSCLERLEMENVLKPVVIISFKLCIIACCFVPIEIFVLKTKTVQYFVL